MGDLKNIVRTFRVPLLALSLTIIIAGQVSAETMDEQVKVMNGFLGDISKWFLGISVGVAAVCTAYGGFLFMTSTGNPDRLDKGKRTIVHTAFGLGICVAATFIAQFLYNVLFKNFGS